MQAEPLAVPDAVTADVTVHALQAQRLARWDAYVNAHPDATFFHRAGWKRVIEEAFGHRTHFLLAERGGEVVGVLPLAERFVDGVHVGLWKRWIQETIDWSRRNGKLADPFRPQDRIDLIERQVAPLYYTRDEDGVPRGWVAMMREAMIGAVPFSATRMVAEYLESLYLRANGNGSEPGA